VPGWARSCMAAGRVVREARSIARGRTTDERFLQLAGLRFEWMIAGLTVRLCRPHLFARPNLPTREHEVIGILCAHRDPTKTHVHLLLLPPAGNSRLADRAVGRRVGWPFPRWVHSCQSTPTVGRPNARRHCPRTTSPKIRSERPLPPAGRHPEGGSRQTALDGDHRREPLGGGRTRGRRGPRVRRRRARGDTSAATSAEPDSSPVGSEEHHLGSVCSGSPFSRGGPHGGSDAHGHLPDPK